MVISIFNEKLVKHVFDDYLGNGEVDLRLSSMSPTSCFKSYTVQQETVSKLTTIFAVNEEICRDFPS